jgi:hypothetical protein
MDQLQAIKLIEAKEFLLENPTESKAVVARIFDINVKTLTAFIRRDEKGRKERDGHNKILESHHEDAIHAYIRSLLDHDLQPTHDLIYSSIVSLKKSYNCFLSLDRNDSDVDDNDPSFIKSSQNHCS